MVLLHIQECESRLFRASTVSMSNLPDTEHASWPGSLGSSLNGKWATLRSHAGVTSDYGG